MILSLLVYIFYFHDNFYNILNIINIFIRIKIFMKKIFFTINACLEK